MVREDDHNPAAASRTAQAHAHRRWTDSLIHRWPSALGVVIVALTAFDLNVNVEFVSFLAALVVFMALVYLGSAALHPRNAAWTVFLVAFVVVVVLRAFNATIVALVVLLIAALGFLALGVARGYLRRSGDFPLQAAAMLVFGAIALVALALQPDIGVYLVAVALLCHGVWDVVHFRRNRVVARSYAEFCAVIDFLLGVAILVFA
jgi:hypothetical protein